LVPVLFLRFYKIKPSKKKIEGKWGEAYVLDDSLMTTIVVRCDVIKGVSD
jgi:hypothetical protein